VAKRPVSILICLNGFMCHRLNYVKASFAFQIKMVYISMQVGYSGNMIAGFIAGVEFAKG
jgi:hypothetical protein